MPLTGRGGYGNFVKARRNDLDPVPSSPAPIIHFSSPKQRFMAGRGGWGNNRPVASLPSMTPEEYLKEVHDSRDVEPSCYAVGRGGFGNTVYRDREKGRARSPLDLVSSPSKSSSSSNLSSNNSGFFPSKSSPLGNQHSRSLWSRLKTSISN